MVIYICYLHRVIIIKDYPSRGTCFFYFGVVDIWKTEKDEGRYHSVLTYPIGAGNAEESVAERQRCGRVHFFEVEAAADEAAPAPAAADAAPARARESAAGKKAQKRQNPTLPQPLNSRFKWTWPNKKTRQLS